ncbi:MAG: ribonuclease HIII [Bacilli bacterium]
MSYTLNLNNSQSDLIIKKYQDYSIKHTNNYTLFRAKYKGATITLYKTLTLLVQGSKAANVYKEICDTLDISVAIEEKNTEVPINLRVIGTDEVGTGDFFGPIIVAGAFVDKDKIIPVMKLGVKDSKDLDDNKIKEIAAELIKIIPFQIVSLDNMKYNYLTQVLNYNMNKIKALLHNDVILKLTQKVQDYDAVIIDAFTTKEKYLDYIDDQKTKMLNVELVEKAESKYLSIACASILARNAFLKQMDKLSDEIGFELPKGASNKVDLAIAKILKEQSESILTKCAKTNFKNLDKVKNNH